MGLRSTFFSRGEKPVFQRLAEWPVNFATEQFNKTVGNSPMTEEKQGNVIGNIARNVGNGARGVVDWADKFAQEGAKTALNSEGLQKYLGFLQQLLGNGIKTFVSLGSVAAGNAYALVSSVFNGNKNETTPSEPVMTASASQPTPTTTHELPTAGSIPYAKQPQSGKSVL